MGRSYGIGKCKIVVARVWFVSGSGEYKVNGKFYDEYFFFFVVCVDMIVLFFVSDMLGLFIVVVDVRGGGIFG